MWSERLPAAAGRRSCQPGSQPTAGRQTSAPEKCRGALRRESPKLLQHLPREHMSRECVYTRALTSLLALWSALCAVQASGGEGGTAALSTAGTSSASAAAALRVAAANSALSIPCPEGELEHPLPSGSVASSAPSGGDLTCSAFTITGHHSIADNIAGCIPDICCTQLIGADLWRWCCPEGSLCGVEKAVCEADPSQQLRPSPPPPPAPHDATAPPGLLCPEGEVERHCCLHG